MPPLVSVILPTYNRGKTLRRAIESVLNQTFDDLELIIIDDRSSDESHAILADYARHSQVRLISQIRHGCAVARNIGIEAAEGRHIAFQDSDDEWLPDKLEKAVALLESSEPEVGIFYSDMLRMLDNGESYYYKAPNVQRGVLIDDTTLDYQVANIGIQSAVIKRECFDKVGLFDESLPRFIDLELFIRLSDQFDSFHCHEALVKYYAGEGISTDEQARLLARQYLLKKYRGRLERHRHHLAQQYLHIAYSLYLTGQKRKTCEFAMRALLTARGHPRIRKQMLRRLRRLPKSLSNIMASAFNKSLEPNR